MAAEQFQGFGCYAVSSAKGNDLADKKDLPTVRNSRNFSALAQSLESGPDRRTGAEDGERYGADPGRRSEFGRSQFGRAQNGVSAAAAQLPRRGGYGIAELNRENAAGEAAREPRDAKRDAEPASDGAPQAEAAPKAVDAPAPDVDSLIKSGFGGYFATDRSRAASVSPAFIPAASSSRSRNLAGLLAEDPEPPRGGRFRDQGARFGPSQSGSMRGDGYRPGWRYYAGADGNRSGSYGDLAGDFSDDELRLQIDAAELEREAKKKGEAQRQRDAKRRAEEEQRLQRELEEQKRMQQELVLQKIYSGKLLVASEEQLAHCVELTKQLLGRESSVELYVEKICELFGEPLGSTVPVMVLWCVLITRYVAACNAYAGPQVMEYAQAGVAHDLDELVQRFRAALAALQLKFKWSEHWDLVCVQELARSAWRLGTAEIAPEVRIICCFFDLMIACDVINAQQLESWKEAKKDRCENRYGVLALVRKRLFRTQDPAPAEESDSSGESSS